MREYEKKNKLWIVCKDSPGCFIQIQQVEGASGWIDYRYTYLQTLIIAIIFV